MAETFQERLVESTVSPTLTEGLDGTPKQADMAGTDAAKKASIAERLEQAPLIDSTQAQQRELFRAERLQGHRTELTADEAIAVETQAQLSNLGNIGQYIQNTINANIEAAALAETGQVEFDGSVLATSLGLSGATLELAKQDPNSAYNQISAVLDTYFASGDPNDQQAAMAAIDNLKASGMSAVDAKTLVGLVQESIAKSTGQTIASNVMDEVTIADIDLQGLGFDGGIEQIATILGMDAEELAGLNIDEFSDKIEAHQKSEFTRIEGLKAELAAAPPGSLKREILLRELRDLGSVGITGVEQAAVENVEDINTADMIKIGDEYIKVADFLDDDNLSERIMDYINEDDPALKDELIPEDQFPELVQWIKNNEIALSQLSTTMTDTTKEYIKANEDYSKLNIIDLGNGETVNLSMDFMKSILPNWDPTQAVTSEDLATIQAAFSATNVGELSLKETNDTFTKSEKKALLNKISSAPVEMHEKLKDLTADELIAASDAADIVKENPALQDFFPELSTSNFILDPNVQGQINDYVDVVNELDPLWINSGYLQGMSPAELQKLVDNPYKFEELSFYHKTKESLDAADTVDDHVALLFGNNVTYEDIVDEFEAIGKWADMGDPESIKKLDYLESIFGTRSPPTETQIAELSKNNFSKLLDMSPSAILDGELNISEFGKLGETFRRRNASRKPTADFGFYGKYLSDAGTFSQTELDNYLAENKEESLGSLGKFLDNNPSIKVDLKLKDLQGNTVTYSSYETYANAKLKLAGHADYEHIANNLARENGYGTLDNLMDWTTDVMVNGDLVTDDELSRINQMSVFFEGLKKELLWNRERSPREEQTLQGYINFINWAKTFNELINSRKQKIEDDKIAAEQKQAEDDRIAAEQKHAEHVQQLRDEEFF